MSSRHTYAPIIGSVGQATLLLCLYYLLLPTLGSLTPNGKLVPTFAPIYAPVGPRNIVFLDSA